MTLIESLGFQGLDLSSTLRLSIILFLSAVFAILYLFRRPAFPAKAPKLLTNGYPLIGSLGFFNQRWDFHHSMGKKSETGNFSYYAGQHRVVGLTGQKNRAVFFESSKMSLGAGYNIMFNQGPDVKEAAHAKGDGADASEDFASLFSRRLVTMMKRENLAKHIAPLLSDIRTRTADLGSSGVTDPFVSIYEIVYQLTMRIVGCTEIANDPALVKETLHLFETIEGSADSAAIIFPSLPTPSKIRRTVAGGKLYMIFKRIVDERKKTGRRDDDCLQFLMDSGDSITDIITFVIGALFAGQLNSGINAAFTLVYLASNKEWTNKCREEIWAIAEKYASDKSAPIMTQLLDVPLEAWEGEFKMIDLCLRDSIRLNLHGTAFRRNISGKDVVLPGGEVIPDGAFATYHIADVHHDPTIYKDPSVWDPSRYLDDRAEHKQDAHAFVGWGSGRHPCLGMRFAKLEQNLIVAHMLATFDFTLCDKAGNPSTELPALQLNEHSAKKPRTPVYLKYGPRA